MFEGVVLAEYHCRYDWRDRHVTDIGAGVFHPTRFASPQRAADPVDARRIHSWCIVPGLAGGEAHGWPQPNSCCSSNWFSGRRVDFIPHWSKGNFGELWA